MKNKTENIQKLRERMTKYCKQMGLPKEPHLITSKAEYNEFYKEGRRLRRNSRMGDSSLARNAIFVNLDKKQGELVWRRYYRRHKACYKRTKWDMREATDTLVHELLHLREPKWGHVEKFYKSIDEIIYKDREFPLVEREELKAIEVKSEPEPTKIIEINPRSYPWIESHFSVYR